MNRIHTAAENVSIISEDFYMPQLDRNRRIWIYLPKDYELSKKKYPVLYMHDGQNLFDDFYSFAGEWEIDKSMNSFFDQDIKTVIIVGIDNGGTERFSELSPWISSENWGGKGDLYASFIAETMKPYIDENYRTLSDRKNTGIMGSSLGGLISFYAGLKYQDIFSKIGIFSPSFWVSESCFAFAAETGKQYDMKMYFLAGGNEGYENVIENCEKMIKTLKKIGFSDEEMLLKSVASGKHNEAFWRQEFPDSFRWLFNDYANMT